MEQTEQTFDCDLSLEINDYYWRYYRNNSFWTTKHTENKVQRLDQGKITAEITDFWQKIVKQTLFSGKITDFDTNGKRSKGQSYLPTVFGLLA